VEVIVVMVMVEVVMLTSLVTPLRPPLIFKNLAGMRIPLLTAVRSAKSR
jgi:hypothetical protein